MVKPDLVESRIERIKRTLRNPVSLTIVAIVVLAFLIRVYYFYHTAGQTLWWDEAEYMSTAKHWAFGVPYNLNPQRPPLFQALAAIFFASGLGEMSVKFFLTLLPSVALVYAIYLLGKEMYNPETGLIAAFLAAVSWTFLFWANRVQPDFFSMLFQVLAICFMWKFWKKENARDIVIAGILSAAGFYFKISALLVPMIFMVFIAVKDRLAAFKNKYYYYYSAAFIGALVPYFIWSQISFGTLFAFRQGYTPSSLVSYAFGWYNLNFYYSLTENLTFILFLVGVIIGLKFLLYLDVLAKDKTKCLDPDLFGIIALAFISAFYIFYMRNTDDRWVYLWMPFIFFFVARALIVCYRAISKKHILAALGVVIILLGICAYSQVSHASSLISLKESSYGPVKDAGLWIKQNSNRTDVVFSVSYTQTVYYSEDNVSTYSLDNPLQSPAEFDSMILADKPRYIMWSVFETHPSWIGTWINEHIAAGDVSVPYYQFADANQTQPMLLVISPIYSKFKKIT